MSSKLSNRVISLLLVFIMAFSMLPTSVFAATKIPESEKTQNSSTKEDKATNNDVPAGDRDANVGTGDNKGASSGLSQVKGWFTNGNNCWGLKFTLYFADEISSEDDIVTTTHFRQLGESIYIQMVQKAYLPSFVGGMNIYERMNEPDGLNKFKRLEFSKIKDNFYNVETNIVGVKVPSVPIMASFPQSLYSEEGASAESIVKFFAGVETTKPLTEIPTDQLDFKNTATIANLILERDAKGYEPITDVNWKQGWLKTTSGAIEKGVFKLYVEPYSDFTLDYVTYYMTLHDAIAFQNEKPSAYSLLYEYEDGSTETKLFRFSTFFNRYLARLANSTFLIRDEPSLQMTGTTKLTIQSTGNDVMVNNNLNGKMKNMGIAVITGGIYENKEVPQIIKTYVEVESVDEDGTIHYKKAAPTTISDIDFYVDETGNYAPFPLFEQLELGLEDESIGLLNDIITTPHDLTVTDVTEWVDTDLITNTGKELQLSSDDVSGYLFGLVTGSEVFIDSYTDYIRVNKKSDSVYKSLMDFAKGIMGGAWITTTWNLFSFDRFRRAEDAEDLTVVSRLMESVKYTHHLSPNQELTKLSINELENLEVTPEVAIVKAGIVDEESGEVVKITPELVSMLEQQAGLEAGLGIKSYSNVVVLRYIVLPNPQQVNIIRYFEKDDDGNLTETKVVVEDAVPLDITEDSVKISKPQSQLPSNAIGDPEIEKWVTNSEYPVIQVVDELPDKSSDGLEGNTDTPITNYPKEPITHNLYVEWKVITEDIVPTPVDTSSYSLAYVPEWRLSRFLNTVAIDSDGDGAVDINSATMSFNRKSDSGHATSTMSNTGTYKFKIVNPNGRTDSLSSMATIGSVGSSNIDNLYLGLTGNSWFYSRGFVVGNDSDEITHDDNSASIDLDATLNMVKSRDNGALALANWVTGNSSLSNYAIDSKNVPMSYTGASQYNKYADLRLGIYNVDTYKHKYGIYYHYTCHHYNLDGDHSGCHGVCGCYTGTEKFEPSTVTYGIAQYGLNVTFDRYIQEATTGLTVAKEYKAENGLTSLRYQLNNVLNIYPEYGMFFEDETGTETLKWVVGDKARQIKPVVYQTLEHKVYVVPNSNGTSVATDSRGITAAKSLASTDSTANGKQLIYKGAGVNTSYVLQRSVGDNKVALLTVKTYALDIGNSTLKSAWNNGTYDPYATHNSLITTLNNSNYNKADVTEKLLVDAKTYGSLDLDNAKKTTKSNSYKLVTYPTNSRRVDNSGNAVCFEHKLIIRGGKLIGIKMMNTDGTYYPGSITMDTLKGLNPDLYNALVNMKLYSLENKKADTLLTVFEHKKGKALTERAYADSLLAARKGIDGLPNGAYTNVNVSEGAGWYSEDTTVLVVKEYVSNFEVPSISVSDKLPLTIKNLPTPTNKTQFFSNLAKGYTYLKYNLNFAAPSVSGIGNIDAYFEFSSYPTDDLDFGRQGVDYIVPNVSITDTTRLN